LTGLGIEPKVGRRKPRPSFSLVRFFWTSKRNEHICNTIREVCWAIPAFAHPPS